jgi:transcriptional regulator
MPDPKSDLLQGTLDLLILQTLGTSGPMHGWAVAQRLQQVSQDAFVLNQGSLYPALHRLEAHGWIDAEWGVSEKGRQAKFYNLTRGGKRQLETATETWERFAAAVGLVLKNT